MKANGRMILFMVTENTSAKMDIFMRDNGIKEKKKVREPKFGQTMKFMSDNSKKD